MCGRYSLSDPEAIYDQYKVKREADFKANYNAAPTQQLPIIKYSKDHVEVVSMRWGLVPFFSKDGKFNFSTFNARAEGLDTKPTYRGPFKRHKCIVPASGYIEWKKDTDDKQPYIFERKDHKLMNLAGLYDVWHEGTEEELRSFTIITTEPNSLSKQVHNRMPVLLSDADVETWLQPESDANSLLGLLCPSDPKEMSMRPINRDIGNVKNNYPELLEIP
jgi:putative SOS response-associated peptidase YedK